MEHLEISSLIKVGKSFKKVLAYFNVRIDIEEAMRERDW